MTTITISQSPKATTRGGPATVALCLIGLAVLAAILVGGGRLIAQIEGDRGIAAVAASHDIQVSGIEVNKPGKTPMEAREAAWAEARKLAWAKLGGPAMSEAEINSLVAAIIGFRLWPVLGSTITVLIATLAVLAVLIGEVWCAVRWLGQRFEKLDLSAELRS